ncbi:MAG TPA: DNA/RNA non-specific endonuclease [Bacteroides reticulotermitis]|nr:DNA/RNA non-specific endonuclease [Bacteroides reticulotermitis]
MKQKYNGALLALLTMFLFMSCGDNNTDDNKGFSIALDRPNNELSGDGGPFSLQVNTIGTWTATIKESWCKLSKNEGIGSGSVTGVVAVNNGEARTATILVTSNGETQSIVLTQTKRDGNPTDPDPEDPDPENPDPEDPDPTPTPEGYASRIEIPKLKKEGTNLFITHTTQINGKEVITYSFEYDCTQKSSRWVAFTFNTSTPNNSVGRQNFTDDPKIPSQYQTHHGDYTGSGYSRGHLVASSDRQYSVAAAKQTFYMSNMNPQIQNGFNGGIWASLEKKVQSWGEITNNQDTLYVTKGGTIDNNNVIEYLKANNTIPVPKYFYMAILSLKNGQYKAIGFWFEHKAYSNNNYAAYAMSIDELEAKTGIDFFHNLDKSTEATVEANYQASDWSW